MNLSLYNGDIKKNICNVIVWGIGILIISVFAFYLYKWLDFESIITFEEYNKEKIVEDYGADLDSELFLFPNDTKNMIESKFLSSLKTNLFDTEGYLILEAKYKKEDYENEVKRLSSVECSVMDIIESVRYDEESYSLPAYVASDGFDNVYEYALINYEDNEIIYVLLSYPQFIDLSNYKEYLKLNISDYEIEDSLERFTIYARKYGDLGYMEYSDERDINTDK